MSRINIKIFCILLIFLCVQVYAYEYDPVVEKIIKIGEQIIDIQIKLIADEKETLRNEKIRLNKLLQENALLLLKPESLILPAIIGSGIGLLIYIRLDNISK